MKKVLSCEDIEFKYQINSKNNIIDGFSYNFLEGKVYLISGFSGCGKSTLFNSLLRFEKPTIRALS